MTTYPPSTLPEPVSLVLRSLIPGIVRTLVPVVVALLLRIGFANAGINELWLERALTLAVTMAYYVVVRLLERHWDKLGWLLGFPAAPVYVPGEVVSVTDVSTPPTTTTVIETTDPTTAGDPADTEKEI